MGRKYRNPRYAPEYLDRRLSPSVSFGSPGLVADYAVYFQDPGPDDPCPYPDDPSAPAPDPSDPDDPGVPGPAGPGLYYPTV